MTTYIIRDTPEGYEFGILRGSEGGELIVTEVGGHGPVEKLYAKVAQAWTSRDRDLVPTFRGHARPLTDHNAGARPGFESLPEERR